MASEWPRNPDASVDVHQVAHLYGVDARTIRRYVRIGKVPPPESKGRMTWTASTIIEYRRAWNWVMLVRRAARGMRGQTSRRRGQTRTTEATGEKPARQAKDRG